MLKTALVDVLRHEHHYFAGFFGITGDQQEEGVQRILEAIAAGEQPRISWAEFVQRAEQAARFWNSGASRGTRAQTFSQVTPRSEDPAMPPGSVTSLAPSDLRRKTSSDVGTRSPTSPQVTPMKPAMPASVTSLPGTGKQMAVPETITTLTGGETYAAPPARGNVTSAAPAASVPGARPRAPMVPKNYDGVSEAELRLILGSKRLMLDDLQSEIEWLQSSDDQMEKRIQGLEYQLKDVKKGETVAVNSSVLRKSVKVKQDLDDWEEAKRAAQQAALENPEGKPIEADVIPDVVGYNAQNTLILDRGFLPIDRTKEKRAKIKAAIEDQHAKAMEKQMYLGHIELPASFFEEQYRAILPQQLQEGAIENGLWLPKKPAEPLLPVLGSNKGAAPKPDDSSAQDDDVLAKWKELDLAHWQEDHSVVDRIGEAKFGIYPDPHPKPEWQIPSWLY